MKTIIIKNVVMTIDPCGKFDNASNQRILEVCGLLPPWIIEASDDELIKDTFLREYVYGLYEMNGCKLNEDGSFRYPGDPTQYPLIKIEKNGEVFYQYEHAIVCIVNKDKEIYFTRMD